MSIPHQLHTSLSTTSIPTPSLTWLQTLLSTRPNPPPPLASLLATARTRLLSTDLTTPGLLDQGYIAAHALPPQLSQTAATTRETSLPADVVVQVLDIEDINRSRWEQVEELEAVARGEGTRGREVVRLPSSAGGAGHEGEDGDAGAGGEEATQNPNQPGQAPRPQQAGKNSTHKLVVQDCKGQKLHAVELRRVERLAVGKTFIGEKILLRAGTVVARGVVMLEPARCALLGGKVEAWHRAWVEGRLARLREAVGAEERREG